MGSNPVINEMLKIMIILPILSILFNKIKNIFLIISIIELYISLYIYIIFNNNNIEFKLYDNLLFLDLSIDSLSLGLIILTNIIFPIIFLIREKTNHFNINFLFSFLLSFLLAIFMINDIIIFYIIFELILIPIFIVVIKYGSKYKRIEAGYKLFIYTIIGSLLFLMGIIIIYNNIKNSNNNYIEYYIYSNNIEQNILIFIYLLFFFSFAIKIPIFPFHT
jgi:NADH-quinone oxidoreductase subunit M